MSFAAYSEQEPSVREQGLYAAQLARYDALFPREQMLVLIYEDIKKDPIAFMRRIYEFLGVDPTFVSSMVHDEINVARTPTLVPVDRGMHHTAEFLRRHGFDRLVHMIRKMGIPDMVRKLNTKEGKQRDAHTPYDHVAYARYFRDDVVRLGARIGRDMCSEWNIE
jgi:hypothetical protein